MASTIPASDTKRIRPGRRLSLRQVLDLQQVSHEAALGLRADFASTTDRTERARVASAIANLAKGWVSLADAKRELLGRPKAGVFKPERSKQKPRPFWPPTLPTEEVQPLPPKPLKASYQVGEA